MKKITINSFRSRLFLAGLVPIVLMTISTIFTITNAAITVKKVSDLFYQDIFIKNTLVEVDAVVTNLSVYLETKNTESLRACINHSNTLQEKATELYGPTFYYSESMLEKNVSVLIKHLVLESELAIQAKRGRNIKEYENKLESVKLIASFIHERADSLALENLKLNLNSFDLIAEQSKKTTANLLLMLFCAILFAASVVMWYSFKLTEPLNSLARAANRISQGDFSGGQLVAFGQDEISQTTKAFNLMQSNIELYIDEIKNKAEIEASLMEEKLKNLEMASHLRSAELKALQSRINPHFLFNTLNAGIQLATIEDADRTRIFLEKLAGLMRYSFRNLDAAVSLQEELKCLKDYTYLMSIRFPDSITINTEIEKEAEKACMPKLVIQPLVENSILHGYASNPTTINIKVSAQIIKSDVIIKIIDNGLGISPEKAQEILNTENENIDSSSTGSGIGLTNVVSRLRLFAEKNDVIEIANAKPGTAIIITLPFKEAF